MKPSFGVIPCLIDKGVTTVCRVRNCERLSHPFVQIELIDNDATGKLYLEAALPGMGRRLTGDNGYQLFREEYFKCDHIIIYMCTEHY